MTVAKPDGEAVRKLHWVQRGLLGAACLLVIGVYAYAAHSGVMESLGPNAADNYYNLLVQGFRAGELSMKKTVPPGLMQLGDPYDPTANVLYRSASYKLFDMSYYKGRLYLYFGVTPALIAFWPFVALTGQYLLNKYVVAVFCVIGFLAGVALLHGLWRRYFEEVSVGVVAACVLALGLATGVPALLPRSEVYEVAISCGYMLMMLALGAIWCALHEPERRRWWLAAASLFYGLAVGARPSLLPGAVILLVPVAQLWRERRPIQTLLMAAIGPIFLIGLALMLYNVLRFDSPFEFGQNYQLAGQRQDTTQHFSPAYLWFNLRVYFLQPAQWSSHFPFVQDMAILRPPPGHGDVEKAFSVLLNIPLVWVTLALPLAWRSRSMERGSTLGWFVAALALLFGINTLMLGFYYFTASRYEVEFLSPLLLLAVVGILGLERAMAVKRLAWKLAVRCGWALLLALSVAFSLLLSVEHYTAALNDLGAVLMQADRVQEAVGRYETALRINPNYADAEYNLGGALLHMGRLQEAMQHWQNAIRVKPDFAEAHYNLGNALLQTGKPKEAIGHWEQALRFKLDYAEAHNDLAVALARVGRLPEAIEHWEQAVRIKPDYVDPHYNLGIVLEKANRVHEAIGHYEQAVRIRPDYAEAHYNLGNALMQDGKTEEAIGHWEQALRIRSDYFEAHYNLGGALARVGRMPEAIRHWEQALRINPDCAEAHYDLGVALVGLGRVEEAIRHWEQALRIKPDYVEAHYNLGVALEQVGKGQEAIGHYVQALKIKPDYTEAQNGLARLRAVP